jgi:magnesium-transporting ATPase (P-type)
MNSDIGNVACECLARNTLELDSLGNATELACTKFLKVLEYPADAKRKKEDMINQFLFESVRKRQSTIVKMDSSIHRIYTKGAAEIVLKCSEYYEEKGKQVKLTEDKKKEIEEKVIDKFNREGLRSIAVSYRDLRPDEGGHLHKATNTDGTYVVEQEKMVLVCILGIRDILRPGVIEAVQKCEKAKITVRMVTGDNRVTAKTIATECQIMKHDHEYAVMDGKEFSEKLEGLIKVCEGCSKIISNEDLMKYKKQKEDEERKKKKEADEKEEKEEAEGDDDDDDEPEIEKQEQQDECPFCNEKKVVEKVKRIDKFKEICPHLCVISRSRPLDKLLLVTALKEMYKNLINF